MEENGQKKPQQKMLREGTGPSPQTTWCATCNGNGLIDGEFGDDTAPCPKCGGDGFEQIKA